jgi:predicted transcriptional regulator
MKTSTYLKQARGTLGLKQGDMAKLLGVRQVNLCKYELDYTIPPGDVILRAMELIKGKRRRNHESTNLQNED